jgi:F-type H+-transporting ATPase subunit c
MIMNRWRGLTVIGLAALLLAPVLVLGQDASAPQATQPAAPAVEAAKPAESAMPKAIQIAAACIAAALAAAGGGIAVAKIGGHCLDAMARQPEAAGQMFGPMFVAAAMIEGAMLFAILVSLLTVLTS